MNIMQDNSSKKIVKFSSARGEADRNILSNAIIETGKGNRASFELLYRKTSAKLFGVCLRIFPNRTEAEDALQDAYLTIWNRASRFEAGRASPISWLVTITRNRAIDKLRASGKGVAVPIDDAHDIADSAPLADHQMFENEEDRRLDHCVNELPSNDAMFIKAAFLKGATYAELAAFENQPLGTVKSRIRRALIKLRACLGERA
jgi:RNA polymerase sigma-70 factor, ECF subfamily